jgi:hypothetical protein
MSCLLRGLLERCFSAERLDGLFESHAREQYTRNLLFSTACDLLLLTVLTRLSLFRPEFELIY